MKVRARKCSKNRNNRSKSGKTCESIALNVGDEPQSRVLRFSSRKYRYVSPLGNVTPKTRKKTEEKIINKEQKGHDSSFEGVPEVMLSASMKRRKRRKLVKDVTQTINNSQSTVEIILISDPPNGDPIQSDGVPLASAAVPTEIEILPSTAVTTEMERHNVNNSEHVNNLHENFTTAKVYDKCEVQKPVSSAQNTFNNISDKSVTKERNELFHMQDKENVSLQQKANDITINNQPCLSVDENCGASASNNVDGECSLNNLQEQQSKCSDKGTRRRREDTEDCDDLNNPRKKRRNVTLTDENTGNLSIQIVDKETDKFVNNASSSCSSRPKRIGTVNVDELETIDLEPDTVIDSNSYSILNNTIELSDGEDAPSDDIIVLGTPLFPSVRSCKTLSKNCGTSSKAETRSYKPPLLSNMNLGLPSADMSQKIIARAISQLSKTMDGSHVQGNIARNDPTLGVNLNKAILSSMVASSSATLPSPNSIYGSNIYNPCGKIERTGLRPVIIDGSNVAMGHGNGQFFSGKGIDICVNYFVKKGHKVFAFVPQFRRGHHNTRESHLLDKLHSEKRLIFTPSRYVDGQSDVPYDDRYIVQTAAELGGVIVSTDNYRDLMQENVQWHDTIKNRLLMFTWVEDLLIFPQDPLGRRGGGLEDFLRF